MQLVEDEQQWSAHNEFSMVYKKKVRMNSVYLSTGRVANYCTLRSLIFVQSNLEKVMSIKSP